MARVRDYLTPVGVAWDDAADIRAGEQAGGLLSILKPRLESRRRHYLMRLSNHLKNDTLTLEIAIGGIAALSELQAIEESLQHEVDIGVKRMGEMTR